MADEKTVADTIERLNHLGHVSSGVGHHVINAFSAIVSNAELLRLKSPLPQFVEPAALADTIVKTALEASTVARRLIDYTRPVTSIDLNEKPNQPSKLSLHRLVEELIGEQLDVGPPGVDWVTDLAEVPPIRGDANQLLAMLRHLVSNCYEALPRQEGTIWLSTLTDNRGWVVIEIRDSGHGMPNEVLVRAVEPFYTTKHGRLGVGLSIANGIWRRHRGTLSLRSDAGEGTLVRLCVEPYKTV